MRFGFIAARGIVKALVALASAGVITTASHAQDLTATASSNSLGAALAVDGQVSFASTWYSGRAQVPGMFFQLDMQHARTVSGLTLETRQGAIQQYPGRFRVLASTNATTWTTVVASAQGGANSTTTVGFQPVAARFIRIELTEAAPRWWAISELTVQRAPIARDGWTASASNNSPAALFALDGANSFGSSWNTGGPQSIGMWFMVDMKQPNAVSEIVMRNTVSSFFARHPEEFEVSVSLDGVNWQQVAASVGNASGANSVAFPLVLARYIRVTITGTGPEPQDPSIPPAPMHWWWISEFEAYDG